MTRKILLPTDGSQHSQRALAWYARHFNDPADVLIFLYVTPPPDSGHGSDVTTSDKMSPKMGETLAKAKLLAADVSHRCTELGIKAHIRFLERLAHNAGQAIVELASEETVDVILIGNRGIGGVKRTFLGSVSDYVLHHSHRTTIIVPPPKNGH